MSAARDAWTQPPRRARDLPHWLQWRALGAMRKVGADGWAWCPMLVPPVRLRLAGACPSWVYGDIFWRACYDLPQLAGRADEVRRVLDLGGNIGLGSLYFAMRFPKAEIVTVEMNARVLPALRANLRRLGARSRLVEAAVSNRTGEVEMVSDLGSASLLNASIAGRISAGAPGALLERRTVRSIDVGELLDRPTGMVKLDIEGAEYDILASDAVVPSRARALVGELHDVAARADELEATLRRLEERGYRISLSPVHGGARFFRAVS